MTELAGECPGDDALACFVEGELAPEDAAAIEVHLDACATCCEVIAELVHAAGLEPPATVDHAEHADASYELERGELVGRYVLLERVGGGGMGVVWAAFDPQLDRRVAIKLLRPELPGAEGSEGRARLLREAQSMARLSHPNVVAVHDVGILEDDAAPVVFLAMEYVDGETLGAWMRKAAQPWPDVLARFVAAGRGLAAAHEQGIVHRDFKPDNVLLGRDGRVCVGDFGLALANNRDATIAPDHLPLADELGEPLTRTGAFLGTPAYMAPEQFAGGSSDARADQFSFCVALWEALYGTRPFAGRSVGELAVEVAAGRVQEPPAAARSSVPSDIEATLRRGLALAPDDRFVSMPALLEQLGRGRERARQRRIGVAAAAVVVVIAAVALGRAVVHDRGVASCSVEADEVHAVWPGPEGRERDRLRAALVDESAPWTVTTVEKLFPELDAWSEEWFVARRDGCLAADVDHTLAVERWESVRRCLDERRDALEALVHTLAEHGPDVVARAIPAATSLPTVAACGEVTTTSREGGDRDAVAAIRRDLARALALELAGRYAQAVEVAESAVESADALEAAGLQADARLQLGRALDRAGDPGRAALVLEEAVHSAVRGGEERLAAECATHLAFVLGASLVRSDDALMWAGLAKDWIALVGESDGMLGASLWARLGSIHNERADYAASRDAHRRALEIRELLLGPDHPEVAGVLNNLGIAENSLGERDAALAHQRRAVEIWERSLGPSHPMVALALTNLAWTLQEREELKDARLVLERALAIRVATVGEKHLDTAFTYLSLCNLDVVDARHGDAHEHCGRALAILEHSLGPDHPDVALALQALGFATPRPGDPTPQELLARALRIREAALGVDHPAVAETHMALGMAHLRVDALEPAQRELELARSGIERAFGAESSDLVPVLLGLARIELVRDHREPAKTLLERAVAIVDAHGLTSADAKAVRTELERAKGQ